MGDCRNIEKGGGEAGQASLSLSLVGDFALKGFSNLSAGWLVGRSVIISLISY